MDSIALMVEEHKNVKRMLAVIRKYCNKILKGEPVRYEDFYDIIDFVRSYTDRHHHGKEESMLFNRMMEEMGSAAEKLIRYGMNVEHDFGRLYMQDLEQAVDRFMVGDEEAKLDIIANAVSYTNLLYRHIEKEDNVVYKFAQRGLSKETLKELDEQCEKYELEQRKQGIQAKYLKLLEKLEAKI